MTRSPRTLTTLLFTTAAATLLMGNTWGGNPFAAELSTNQTGTIDSFVATVTDVVSHPCDESDPIFVEVDETVDLVAGFEVTPGGGEICRIDLLLEGYPTLTGTVGGDPVVEVPTVDKLIFDSRVGEPEDATIYGGDFGWVKVSLTAV